MCIDYIKKGKRSKLPAKAIRPEHDKENDKAHEQGLQIVDFVLDTPIFEEFIQPGDPVFNHQIRRDDYEKPDLQEYFHHMLWL